MSVLASSSVPSVSSLACVALAQKHAKTATQEPRRTSARRPVETSNGIQVPLFIHITLKIFLVLQDSPRRRVSIGIVRQRSSVIKSARAGEFTEA
jgi:hypothetical protein